MNAVAHRLRATHDVIVELVEFVNVVMPSSRPAFPPFAKGGQGGIALDVEDQKQIPLYPSFAKGEKA